MNIFLIIIPIVILVGLLLFFLLRKKDKKNIPNTYSITLPAGQDNILVHNLKSQNGKWLAYYSAYYLDPNVTVDSGDFYVTPYNYLDISFNGGWFQTTVDGPGDTPSNYKFPCKPLLTKDGDFVISCLDDKGKDLIIWSASKRGDNIWSKGSGAPYTLSLSDDGILSLSDSQGNITFTTKNRYLCDKTGCSYKVCPNLTCPVENFPGDKHNNCSC
jgi:hypothetical protein